MRTLIIEIYREADHWKMSAFYKGESLGHRQYSIQQVSEKNIQELCADVFNILSRVDNNGTVTDQSIEELRKSCHLLYDQIFSRLVKDKLRQTNATHLIFHIDEQLVHIPWELLHDGADYLSLRFATGRVVLTAQAIHSESGRDIKPELKMLAVCDPTGDLKDAYKEGIIIRNEIDKTKKKLKLDLRATEVDLKYTLKNLKEYDIFHFAGHAKYDQADPSKSGLILKDGTLTAEQITTLGGSTSMPALVFMNACSSGEAKAWPVEPAQENRIYGLANVFLLAGVKHYIGTFWRVQDRLCMDFAREFYHNIRENIGIGEALRQARLYSIKKYGQNSLIWASYMLYGDPSEHLFPLEKKTISKKRIRKWHWITACGILLIAGFISANYFLKLKEETPGEVLEFKPLPNVFYAKQDGTVKIYDELQIFDRNITLGKDMYASSAENNAFIANFASDNNLDTRWSSEFSDPQWIYVDLGEITPIGQIRLIWEIAFAHSYEIQVSDDAIGWKTAWKTSRGSVDNNVIDLRGRNISGRYVRVYCKERGTDFGNSLWEFEIYPDLPPNTALGKEAFASSGRGKWGPDKAVDGDRGTRWGSDYEDPQWLYVDLKDRHRINMITVDWEAGYGKLYKIQKSDDGKHWIDVCRIHNMKRRKNNIYFGTPFSARYIRLYGIERASSWGYSIWEFEVRGMKE